MPIPPRASHAPFLRQMTAEVRRGALSRRDFLSRATALGVSAATAYAFVGGSRPARAQTSARGGTLRMQMEVRAQKDPRLYDWTQMAYVTAGTLEYLVDYRSDGSFHPMLLAGWEANADATEYRLSVRAGVTWSNGEAFTAEDVARNIHRWCDRSVEGNSMATRMDALIDTASQRARYGAITVEDARTVLLRLDRPDISLIPNMADYPAAIVHENYSSDAPLTELVGTGPMRIESFEEQTRAVLVRTERPWWGDTGAYPGGGFFLDRIEFIDYGQDPAAWRAAAEAGEVDALYETVGEFIAPMDALGWTRSEIATGNTVVIRTNRFHKDANGLPVYAQAEVRRALAMAVDNGICLELGYAGRGVEAGNSHVGPMHPAWDSTVSRLPYDPKRAGAILAQVGLSDYEHELFSIDDDWRRNTADAVAVQLRDAGIKVKRSILPARAFWSGWTGFGFSTTNWNHRPLATQTLSLAYKTGEAWNETGFSSAAFDRLLEQANTLSEAEERREVMGELQRLLIEDGTIIQPYWRALYRHYSPAFTGLDMHVSYLPQMHRWARVG